MSRIIKLMLRIAIARFLIDAEKQKELNLNVRYFLERICLISKNNTIHTEFKRIELVRSNNKLIGNASMTTRKYNRTQPVTNCTFTLKENMGYNMTFIVQAYKFISNEYRYYPLRFGGHVCDALASNVVGVKRLFKCGNFTGCPFVKNTVNHFCNFYPDPEKFPPMVPNGDFKIEIQYNYLQEEFLVVDLYITNHHISSNCYSIGLWWLLCIFVYLLDRCCF